MIGYPVEVCVKPKNKVVVLIFALVIPYISLVMYLVLRSVGHPNGQPILPGWFPYFGMVYILGAMLVASVYSRRVARNAQGTGTDDAPKPRPVVRMATRAWAGYLVVVWSGLFVYGVVETIRGKFEWQRAVPAGAFLLVFIVAFARLLYVDLKNRKQGSDTQATS